MLVRSDWDWLCWWGASGTDYVGEERLGLTMLVRSDPLRAHLCWSSSSCTFRPHFCHADRQCAAAAVPPPPLWRKFQSWRSSKWIAKWCTQIQSVLDFGVDLRLIWFQQYCVNVVRALEQLMGNLGKWNILSGASNQQNDQHATALWWKGVCVNCMGIRLCEKHGARCSQSTIFYSHNNKVIYCM